MPTNAASRSKPAYRLVLCPLALVFLLGATSRVDSILDIPEGTTIDFEIDNCIYVPPLLIDCFAPFDMLPNPDPRIDYTPFQGGTEDAPFGGGCFAFDDPVMRIETSGRPWEAIGLTAKSLNFNPEFYTRTRLRALDESGEELGQVNLALFGREVRFLGIASDRPIHAIEISGGASPLLWDTIRFLPAAGAIDVDIKPGSPQNVINPRSEGVLQAAILGSADLDVHEIAQETITLAGATVRRQGADDAPLCQVRPVNHDAWPDLVCLFETDEIKLQEGATSAVLQATTSNGDRYQGSDSIHLVSHHLPEPPEPPGETPDESPRIESVDFWWEPQTTATCDFTSMFLANFGGGPAVGGFCDDGPILLGPLLVQSTYDTAHFQVTATDPQSTPAQNDIRLVAVSFPARPTHDAFVILVDDGSSDVSWIKQKFYPFPEDCFYDHNQRACTCEVAFYDVISHDAIAGDDVYTRVHPFVDGDALPPGVEGLALDCIAMQDRLEAIIDNDVAGRQFDFRIEAVDQSGNLTEWPDPPSALVGPSSLTCSGDPCACCLLLNRVNPADEPQNGGCRGLDGLMFDPTVKICKSGDPALLGTPCVTNSDCDGLTGNGFCWLSPFGRACPDGFCKSSRCLRP